MATTVPMTAVYVNATTFTVSGNYTTEFSVGTVIAFYTTTTSPSGYGEVQSVSWVTDTTTVILKSKSNTLGSDLAGVAYHITSYVPAHDHKGDSVGDGDPLDHTNLQNKGSNTHTQIDAHISGTGNPHSVTHTQVGSATAQWNANKVQGKTMPSPTVSDDDHYLQYDHAGSQYTLVSGTGGGGGGISSIVEDTTPQLGGDLDLNTKNINYGAILTVNDEYEGDIITVTVDDASAAFGNPLYCATDFHYERCDADAAITMPCVCLALESGAGSKKVLLKGQICDTAWSWNAGLVYVSCTTGELTQTTVSGSGDQAQVVGFATHANTMVFNPNYMLIEIS